MDSKNHLPEDFPPPLLNEFSSSSFHSIQDDTDYWSSFVPKCDECKAMLKQLLQMKQTIKTLVNINQEQHWTLINCREDSAKLETELQNTKWKIHLLETELVRVKTEKSEAGNWKNKENMPFGVNYRYRNGAGKYYYNGRRKQYYNKASTETLESTQTNSVSPMDVTDRIQELMNTAGGKPLDIPFRFDKFESQNNPDQKSDQSVKVAEFQALASIFAGTATTEDKPIEIQSKLSVEKELEKELHDAIKVNDAKKLAETILKAKLENQQDIIDIKTAEKKLEEILKDETNEKDKARRK